MISMWKTKVRDKNSENRRKWLIMGQNRANLPPDTPRKHNLVFSEKPPKSGHFGQKPLFQTPGESKRGENEFSGKSENVMFLHSLRLSYMQKSENSIARFSGKTG